ncbi:MAG: hypothetical protein QXD49_07045 [Archaeoglobaceae archaeon]
MKVSTLNSQLRFFIEKIEYKTGINIKAVNIDRVGRRDKKDKIGTSKITETNTEAEILKRVLGERTTASVL